MYSCSVLVQFECRKPSILVSRGKGSSSSVCVSARDAPGPDLVPIAGDHRGFPGSSDPVSTAARRGDGSHCDCGRLLVQTASVNVDCRKAEWLECFISCIIGWHTPARVLKEDEESRSEPHGTPKHNPELCGRIAHYSTARNRHFWRDTTDTLPGSSQDGD